MKYLAAVHTDVGTRRKKNQDSMIVMEAQTGTGNILFGAVCDGMGGLDRGEAASAAMIHAFADWFEARLIYIARAVRDGTFQKETLREEWSSLIENTSRCIEDYGRERHICLGTTAVGILICEASSTTAARLSQEVSASGAKPPAASTASQTLLP